MKTEPPWFAAGIAVLVAGAPGIHVGCCAPAEGISPGACNPDPLSFCTCLRGLLGPKWEFPDVDPAFCQGSCVVRGSSDTSGVLRARKFRDGLSEYARARCSSLAVCSRPLSGPSGESCRTKWCLCGPAELLEPLFACGHLAAKCSSDPHILHRIIWPCLLYTSPSPRDGLLSRMPSSA